MKISKYTKLGFLIVFCFSALIWGLSYLKGHDFFKDTKYYHVIYERVDGLVQSDAVTLNGYQVGQVKSIKFIGDGSGKLIVTISVDGSFKLPVNSVARIVSSDIMGTRSVKLIYNQNEEIYQSNDTIPGTIEGDLKEQVSLQVLPLKSKAEQLLATIDSAITILTVIFNEDARDNLSESFENINNTIANIEETSSSLKDLINKESSNISSFVDNLNSVSGTFKTKSEDFDKIITNLAALSDSLSALPYSPLIESIANITGEMEQVLQKLNSTEGTAGNLINDDQLYTNLLEMSTDLDNLLKDIRLNPKRYVSFSAIDLGKEVYFTSSGSTNNEEITFRVNLISTPSRIPINSELFEGLGEVEEFAASGAFSYMVGTTNNYEEISKLRDNAVSKFPDATIIAFKNGKMIKLERALKKIYK